MPAKKPRRLTKSRFKKCDKIVCEYCQENKGVLPESSRTAYNWNGKFDSKDDPNRDKLLCRKCAKLHHEFWDIMWKNYGSHYLNGGEN
jgi:hypothetical protein